jgi:hypothetical protein
MISESEYPDLHVYSCGQLQVAPAGGGSDNVVALVTTEADDRGWWLTREEALELIADLSAAVRRADLEDVPA